MINVKFYFNLEQLTLLSFSPSLTQVIHYMGYETFNLLT